MGGPVNALYTPGGPTLAELGALGVARVSFGGGLLRGIKAEIDRIAAELAQAAWASGTQVIHGQRDSAPLSPCSSSSMRLLPRVFGLT
jgi:2-methylisocitrate lyase-like PEP mutase family enzyme